ncbi:uncharacterized protein LOC129737840 [Uranotaenia lowii]|uniref:uncharacterized protein LOC129737840 n=1 Tax=Uranotaenia lowii TaxID=190385 RepID=UPI00247ADBF9|nr:uncharacterized protein LOC129737840 [Uranotaenia lowii]
MALISAASDVTVLSDFDNAKSNKRERERAQYVNFHAAESTIATGNSRGTNVDRPCFVCGSNNHRIRDCQEFRTSSLANRWQLVDTHRLCCKCLIPHGRWPCKNKIKLVCFETNCTGDHHTLLHPGRPIREQRLNQDDYAAVNFHHAPKATVLFRILPVVLYGNGREVKTLAFLDEGSSVTLLQRDISDELGITGIEAPLRLLWTANVTREELDSQRISLAISADVGKKRLHLKNVRTVRKLDLPAQSLSYECLAARFPHLSNLPLQSYQNATPKILIGLDNIHLSIPLKIREGPEGEPVAAKSRLGWTIFGRLNGLGESKKPDSLHIHKCSDDTTLHDLVKDFFSLESLGICSAAIPQSEEIQRANELLEKTTTKSTDGHFITGLLWRYDKIEFPTSYQMAEKRLRCLERRLDNDRNLRIAVDKLLADYQIKGYAHKASEKELKETDPKRCWYLPLGVVINPRKPGKVRIIWDAAAKANGVSFNDMLLKGPDMLTPLPTILYRFRQRQYCITGDIKEMYHQIKILDKDRQAQRFLWRSDPHMKPDVYSFGATCSPCSAQYIKNLNAKQWASEYPEASAAIELSHYVDDFVDSRDTVDEVVQLALDVKTVHAYGGFELRNFLSNSTEILRRMGVEDAVHLKEFEVNKTNCSERVLGMSWYPAPDHFKFSINVSPDLLRTLSGETAPTKRSILRFVMSLFDPLGMISHYLIHGKSLIQDLWRIKAS